MINKFYRFLLNDFVSEKRELMLKASCYYKIDDEYEITNLIMSSMT